MKNILVLFILQCISVCIWAQNPNPSVSVSNAITNEMNIEKIPGAATLIIKNGQVVWVESFGDADIANNKEVTENTIFLIASISKVFTGTALMTLVDDGLINLDDPINPHLPFPIDVPNFNSTPITFRMLLTHTASIQDNGNVTDDYYSDGDPTISLAGVMQRYFDTNGSDYSATGNFHNKKAGTFYNYTNMGSALVGYLVERISGMPFDQYCKTHIFDPLSMNNTSWFLNGLDINKVAIPYEWQGGQYSAYDHYGFADYPNGQLRLSILDLGQYMNAFLQNGTLDGNEILSSTAVAEMLRLQVPNLNATQGLKWYQEKVNLNGGGRVTLWGHNGGEDGVSTDMYINPDNGIGVAVLSNGEGDNSGIIEELYNYALGLSTTSLAVEQTSFTVQAKNKRIYLDWRTTAEMNNKGFEIEHSMNGSQWENIGFVKGNGDSRHLSSYQFVHQSPAEGVNYYRLKQLDNAGGYEYSIIKKIDLVSTDNQLFIYPNPVEGEYFSLSVRDVNLDSGQLFIFDSIGCMVQSQTITNRVTLIPIHLLPKGIYSVVLEHNGQKFWEKFIVQ